MNNQKHEFALHIPDLAHHIKKVGTEFIISDAPLIHRIITVLRLHVGERIRLFDNDHNGVYILDEIGKKKIVGVIERLEKNQLLRPHITVLMPLLKKDALAQAIYSCVELGAQEIQFVATAKTQRSNFSPKEFEHLKKIAVSAAEQSKNFILPLMHAPQSLSSFLQESHTPDVKIFFDPSGKNAQQIIDSVQNKPRLTIMIGPEGDLIGEEKELLKKQDFLFCALTPTILRAQQALVVGVGLMRSMFRS